MCGTGLGCGAQVYCQYLSELTFCRYLVILEVLAHWASVFYPNFHFDTNLFRNKNFFVSQNF